MQTVFSYIGEPKIRKKVTSDKTVRLTTRDLEILEFILTMKFSTLEDIHSKFFRITIKGEISNSFWWAKDRVNQLLKAGYIQTVKNVSIKVFYVLTKEGYYFLQNSEFKKLYCSPCYKIDIRILNHDWLIQKIRIHLENFYNVSNWQSERILGADSKLRIILPKEFRPDGIYLDAENRKIAFELEIARKSHKRYDEKIRRYISLMQDPSAEFQAFEKVHVVCADVSVAKLWVDKTKIYRELFLVETVNQIFEKKESNEKSISV